MLNIFNKILSCIVIACVVFCSPSIFALPEGEVVQGGGTATFDRTVPNELTVTTPDNRLWTDWNSFSIASPETVTFNQPDASSIALNRVTGGDPSQIFGALNANGRVFLINPNGIVFGINSTVDVAGLLASTLDIDMTPAAFVAGSGDTFTFSGSGAHVVNYAGVEVGGVRYGKIALNAPGGYVALLGSSVKNVGLIEANLGKVILAAGEQMTVDLDPAGLISVAVNITQETTHNDEDQIAAVNNRGTIVADGGKVILSADILDGVFTSAVNNDGIIEANAIGADDGQVYLRSNQDIQQNGTITASGSVDMDADRDILLGMPVEDLLLVSFSWEYLGGDRAYKFKEFGYYYDDGVIHVVLSQGNDIGKDVNSPTWGEGIIELPGGIPEGLYTIFDTTGIDNMGFLTYYQDPALNPDGLEHLDLDRLALTGTEYAWEDMYVQGDQDFNDAIIDYVSQMITVPPPPYTPPEPPPEEFGIFWERLQEFRVYYEILDPSQFLSFEPAKYIGLYAYHPLTPTDSSAFDEIELDAGAYDFIDGDIKAKKPLGPYFNL